MVIPLCSKGNFVPLPPQNLIECCVSFPPRKICITGFKQRLATSVVTLGRARKWLQSRQAEYRTSVRSFNPLSKVPPSMIFPIRIRGAKSRSTIIRNAFRRSSVNKDDQLMLPDKPFLFCNFNIFWFAARIQIHIVLIDLQ